MGEAIACFFGIAFGALIVFGLIVAFVDKNR